MVTCSNQFRIYWDNNSKKYEPDFIVETQDGIYMVETKANQILQDDEVYKRWQQQRNFAIMHQSLLLLMMVKKWTYVLVPHRLQ